jgi:hypothetical protein
MQGRQIVLCIGEARQSSDLIMSAGILEPQRDLVGAAETEVARRGRGLGGDREGTGLDRRARIEFAGDDTDGAQSGLLRRCGEPKAALRHGCCGRQWIGEGETSERGDDGKASGHDQTPVPTMGPCRSSLQRATSPFDVTDRS